MIMLAIHPITPPTINHRTRFMAATPFVPADGTVEKTRMAMSKASASRGSFDRARERIARDVFAELSRIGRTRSTLAMQERRFRRAARVARRLLLLSSLEQEIRARERFETERNGQMTKTTRTTPDANRDPITGEPGSHPVATGVGAAGGGAAGAVAGAAIGGPLGALVGGAAGAIAGGAAGHAAAEAVDPTEEAAYWREQYRSRPYVDVNRPYSDYESAYRYGWESRSAYPRARWEEVEPRLGEGWNRVRAGSRLAWEEAREATRDAWHRIERSLPGDADRDGR
jgi:hypothetical protein